MTTTTITLSPHSPSQAKTPAEKQTKISRQLNYTHLLMTIKSIHYTLYIIAHTPNKGKDIQILHAHSEKSCIFAEHSPNSNAGYEKEILITFILL
ncbi:hypothetical protein FIN92_00880 [Prevotella brunnea]|uniref:hypothetical protein n=1 Tax=Prevotella brunnea TaxID=2508867 RepID=UPI002821F4C7|nr:hypothetical protein [Prevotella brunnea]MDR0185155.1 hypothetical protein [Prevotella brunnea]